MSSEGLVRISCPLGEYWRALGESVSVIVAETVTEAEARLARQYYMAGFHAGTASSTASSVVSTVSIEEPKERKEFNTVTEHALVPYMSSPKVRVKARVRMPSPPHPGRLAVANGVLHFASNTLHPADPAILVKAGRLGHHDPIPYHPSATSDELMEFLHRLFPDPDVLEYVLCAVASCIDGVRRTPNLFLCHGLGSNGKSAFSSLVEMTLGEYATTMGAEALCRKSQLDAIKPLVAGARWIGVGEPVSGAALHMGTLTNLLDSNVAHLFLFTCELPSLKADDAFWSKVRVIPFLTTFASSGSTEPDLELRQKLPRWRTAFLSLLVSRVTAATACARAEPERVLQATRSYRRANDPFQQFISEYLIPTEDATLTPTELRNHWREFRTTKSLGKTGDPKESDVLERLVGSDGLVRGFSRSAR